jgi:hypothetical protein
VKIMSMPVFGTFLQVSESTRNNNRIGITFDYSEFHRRMWKSAPKVPAEICVFLRVKSFQFLSD